MTASALYQGRVTHHRTGPVEHELSYPISMPLLDLDELPRVLDPHPLWSARRPAPVRFRASDFLGAEPGQGPGSPSELTRAARALVAERTGRSPAGPVRLLASPRFLGVGFNPVSFFFLYGESERVEAVIAEVTNTPWGDRHRYVVARSDDGPVLKQRIAKRLHVSPFMPMEQVYELRAGEPGESLAITITSEQDGRRVFAAGLSLKRREITRAAMARVLVSYPPSTIATLARIYGHGLRLRLKGVAPHSRPKPATAASALDGH